PVARAPESVREPTPFRRPSAAPQPPAMPPAPPVEVGAPPDWLAPLLAKAKAYRPLAKFLLDEMRKAGPGAALVAQAGQVGLRNPQLFAVLVVGAKELRLGLDLGERSYDAHLQKSRIAGVPASISHAMMLTDARQVDEKLLALVAMANARVNGPR